ARRLEAEAQFGPIPRPVPQDGTASEAVTEREEEVAKLVAQLTAGISEARDERDDQQQARWLLAQMLDWHRREAKPDWWMFFARQHVSDDELLDDRESISGLDPVGEIEQIKQSTVYRYAFTPQDHKFAKGKDAFDPLTGKATGEVMDVDDVDG